MEADLSPVLDFVTAIKAHQASKPGKFALTEISGFRDYTPKPGLYTGREDWIRCHRLRDHGVKAPRIAQDRFDSLGPDKRTSNTKTPPSRPLKRVFPPSHSQGRIFFCFSGVHVVCYIYDMKGVHPTWPSYLRGLVIIGHKKLENMMKNVWCEIFASVHKEFLFHYFRKAL
jgi:hypothetical protein